MGARQIFKGSMVFCVGLLLLVVSFSACGGGAPTPPAAKTPTCLEAIQQRGVLVIGTSADYPPYEFHINENGQDRVIGLDIAIANAIAEDLKVKLEIREMKFSELLEALLSDQVDAVLAGLAPTTERRARVGFSDVYYRASQNLVIRGKDKERIRSVKDLAGGRVGAQTNSLQEGIARSMIKDPKVHTMPRIQELISALQAGEFDALVMEGPVAKAFVALYPELMTVGIEYIGENDVDGSAVAIRKNCNDLEARINLVLKDLQARNKIMEFVQEANIKADQLRH